MTIDTDSLQKSQKNFDLKKIIIIFFGLIYCIISLVNHYNFRTYAWDLGLYNHAIYDYAHFRFNHYTLDTEEGFTNPLGNHFELIPMLVSPFYWIFGSYTMLIFQIAIILFGGYGIYTFVRERNETKYIPEMAMFHFFSMWGIYSALSFDYHNNVAAAMFIPWFIHFFELRKWTKSTAFFLLIIISKENMALWMIFISLGLLFMDRKNITKVKIAGFYAFSALLYFIVVLKGIMPIMAGAQAVNGYVHFNQYSTLDGTTSGLINTLATKPGYILKLFFVSHISSGTDAMKQELHAMVMISGGILFFTRPQFFIMLLPIYAQKLLNDTPVRWGITGHYSIEFIPIIALAVFYFIQEFSNRLLSFLVYSIFIALSIYSTYQMLEYPTKAENCQPDKLRFYEYEYYSVNFDRAKVYDVLNMIPDDAAVSAQSQLVPHLTSRKIIYQYPTIKDAEYIVLLSKINTYPLEKDQFDLSVKKLSKSIDWSAIYSEGGIYLFKKNSNN